VTSTPVLQRRGYAKAETNNEKAFMVRGTVRPFPLGGTMLKGLRLTAFLDEDHYVQGAKRERDIGQVTYEASSVQRGFDLLHAKDRTSATKAQISGKGWSLWVTPKLGTKGWEALIRHDDYLPNDAIHSQSRSATSTESPTGCRISAARRPRSCSTAIH